MGQSPLAYVLEGLMGLLGLLWATYCLGAWQPLALRLDWDTDFLSHPDWAVSATLRVLRDPVGHSEQCQALGPRSRVTAFRKNSGMVPNSSWKTLQIFLRLGPHETLGQ